MDNNVRTIPISRGINRPNLLLGGDRELVMISGIMAAVLIFSVVTLWSALIGILLWLVAIAAFSRMGKADPLMRHVFLKHQQYQDYYPASSRWCVRKNRTLPKNWKG